MKPMPLNEELFTSLKGNTQNCLGGIINYLLNNMGVRNTSRQAFHSLNDLGDRQRFILEMILNYGPICNLDISIKSGKPINQVTPRTNELVEMGLVEESHREVNPVTNRKAIYWKPTKKGIDLFNSLF